MKTSELKELRFEPINDLPEREIAGGFCGDLLSWVMGRAEENQVWFTVMANINVVAVATLADFAAVVFCHGVRPADEIIQKATEEGIPLFVTEHTEYGAAEAFALRMRG